MQPVKTEKVDLLDVRVYADREAMGNAAGADVVARMRKLLSRQRSVRMVFAAAPSQNEVLRTISTAEGVDWTRVSALHMDEYVGLSEEAPQSFGRYLRDALFDVVEPGEVHLIDGTKPVAEECARYAALLQSAPIDIVILGIGENGHIAFNDPPVADFDDPETVKPVDLDEASRRQQVNDGVFPSVDEVPVRALTMTIPALMSGAHLFCIVPGATKRDALDHLLRDPISTACPASILRRHPNCTLYADLQAYGSDPS